MGDLVPVVTLEELQEAFPSRKRTITQELVDVINECSTEPEFQIKSLLDSMVTYEGILHGKSRVTLRQYMDALRFCTYMIANEDNATQSYIKTFAYRDFIKERVNEPTNSKAYKEITQAASRYKGYDYVRDILTITSLPFDIIHLNTRHEAVGVLREIMLHGKYDKDRLAAADKLLTHTKGPDHVDLNLNIGPSSAAISMQEQLNMQLQELAMNQRKLLEQGMTIQEVQKTGINLNVIEGEYEEA